MQDVTKTIGEIRDVLDNVCTGVSIEKACTFANCNECKAKAIYNAGYRKVDEMTKEEILQYAKEKFSLDLIDKKEVVNYLEEERIKKKKKVADHYAEVRECREHIGCDDTGVWENCLEYEKKQAEICDKQSEILLIVKHWVEGR